MAKSIAEWKSQALGHKIDLDNQSYDCVDVPKHWAQYLYDKPWTESLAWGNAKDIWGNVSASYWDRIPRGGGVKVGDIVCMGAGIGGGYGHVAVVIEVNGGNITVAQQDTFLQVAVYTGVWDANASYIQGYLRPKVAFDDGSQPEVLQPYQRKVASDVVNYRQGAGRNYPLLVTDANPDGQFSPSEVLDFKGFVHGENVDGNDVWFVGMYSGGYAWSAAFTDQATHDLADLTPATLKPTQRQIGGDAMNWRLQAELKPENVIKVLPAGQVLDLTGFVRGFLVDGNNVWFQYKEGETTGYVWSGGFADSATHDLVDLTQTTPEPEVPVYPVPTTDPLVTKVFNKKNPIGETYAPADLVSVGSGQTLRSEAAASLTLAKNIAAKNGVVLTPQSGYRSFATQKTVYDAYVKQDGQTKADTYSARPGYSEHQTGLALDFSPIDDAFVNTEAYKWLAANAYKYGWVLRYPSDKTTVTGYTYEPWHWRYVGVTVAADMRATGKTTLEEYFNIAGGLYPDQEPTDPTEPTDPEEPEEPSQPEKDATVEAMKVIGRNGLLAAISAAIAATANWLLQLLAGVDLPNDLIVAMGGVIYAALLAIDKYIHENIKLKWRGLIGF